MSVRILVVDDEEDQLDVFKRLLTRAGFDVTVALGPAEARQAVGASAFDLLLCDVEMPETRGPILATELVAMQPSLQVILMSGSAIQDSVQYRLIPKPCSTIELISTIKAVVGMQS